MRTPLFLLLPFAFVAGCAPSPGNALTDAAAESSVPFKPDPCKSSLAAGASATLTVGEGQTFFRDIPDGQELIWEKGPQGGHHVWVAVRVKGIRMQGTITSVDLDDIQTPSAPININHSRLVYDLTREEGGHCVLPGLRMQIDYAGGVPLAGLQGHRIRITASLKDLDGHVATATKEIVVKGVLD